MAENPDKFTEEVRNVTGLDNLEKALFYFKLTDGIVVAEVGLFIIKDQEQPKFYFLVGGKNGTYNKAAENLVINFRDHFSGGISDYYPDFLIPGSPHFGREHYRGLEYVIQDLQTLNRYANFVNSMEGNKK